MSPGDTPKAPRLSVQTIDLSKESDTFVAQFASELFTVHNAIFSGLDEDAFSHYVFRSGATRTKIRIYRNSKSEIVGYAAVHRYDKKVSTGPVTVFRAEAGLLPQYRAHGTTFYFYTLELLKYRLLHPLQRIFYLGMLVHPSSYLVFARHFHEVYPKHDCEIPADMRRLMQSMADDFGIPRVDPVDPMIRRVGWRTRRAKHFWIRTEDPDVVFFRERNPGYRQGHGLLVLVPITFMNLAWVFPMYVYKHLQRRLAARSRMERKR
jgi:hypothetical protein